MIYFYDKPSCQSNLVSFVLKCTFKRIMFYRFRSTQAFYLPHLLRFSCWVLCCSGNLSQRFLTKERAHVSAKLGPGISQHTNEKQAISTQEAGCITRQSGTFACGKKTITLHNNESFTFGIVSGTTSLVFSWTCAVERVFEETVTVCMEMFLLGCKHDLTFRVLSLCGKHKIKSCPIWQGEWLCVVALTIDFIAWSNCDCASWGLCLLLSLVLGLLQWWLGVNL